MPGFPIPASRTASTASTLAVVLVLMANNASAAKIAEGAFVSKGSAIEASGGFEVQESSGKYTLVINGDFRSSEGPDLFFVFNPLPAAQVTGSNAKTSALKVTPGLKSLSGAQTYTLPDGFDIGKYSSLLVHCWQFDHLYSSTAIVKATATGIGGHGKRVVGDAAREAAPDFRFQRSGMRLVRTGTGGKIEFDLAGKSRFAGNPK